jgi:hypothetical protein
LPGPRGDDGLRLDFLGALFIVKFQRSFLLSGKHGVEQIEDFALRVLDRQPVDIVARDFRLVG